MMFTSLILSAAVALPAFVSALPGDCTRTYKVAAGDICDAISAHQNSSTYQLWLANRGVVNDECTNLQPDQDICLATNGTDCSTTYVVVRGDTCNIISSKTGVSLDVLGKNNPQINPDCSNAYVDEVLCVAKEALGYPARADAPITSGSAPLDPIPFCN